METNFIAGRPRGLEASWGWRDGQSRPARVPPTARVRLAQSRVGSAEGPRPGPQLRPPFPGPRTGGNLSPGRLHAALGAGGTKAAFQPESPCRAEGPQGPRGHCWPVQPPLPCASCNVDVELRSPPGPGQSRVPLVRPAGVSGLGRGWGQLLRPEPCPPLAPGRPSASQGLFPHVRLRQAARAHLPLLGRPLLGEASGQWARGSGQPRRGQRPGEQEGWGPACGVGGLSTASSRQKTLSGARCPCSSVSSANCSASCHKPMCGLVGVGRVLLAPLRSESSLRGLPASRDGSRPRSCASLAPTEVGSFL